MRRTRASSSTPASNPTPVPYPNPNPNQVCAEDESLCVLLSEAAEAAEAAEACPGGGGGGSNGGAGSGSGEGSGVGEGGGEDSGGQRGGEAGGEAGDEAAADGEADGSLTVSRVERAASSGVGLSRLPESMRDARRQQQLRETHKAQAALQPRHNTVAAAAAEVSRAKGELDDAAEEVRRARDMLLARRDAWDTDELAGHWAQAQAALHAKDRSMAALLARRRTARQKVVKLLQYLPEALAALPERERVLEGWRQQCDTLRAHLLHSSLLIAEEVAVANMLAENRAESVLGPVGPHIGPEPVMLSLWS